MSHLPMSCSITVETTLLWFLAKSRLGRLNFRQHRYPKHSEKPVAAPSSELPETAYGNAANHTSEPACHASQLGPL